MSYNYDLNPWDDDVSQQTASAGGGYQTAGGYSNPMEQYADTSYQQQQQPQYGDYDNSQQQQVSEQVYQEEQPPPQQPPESAVKRFLRAHVPLCGTFLDLTSKVKVPFLDVILKHVNRDLLVSKVFYFFFYSAFGSLFPLMGVYFKQMGMNPAQVGILTGVRPFIEIFSAPFWSSLAERFQKAKALLLFSLLSWIIFTYSLAHIRPPASACIAFNDTDYVLYTPYSANELANYESSNEETAASELQNSGEVFMNRMPSSSAQQGGERESKDAILAQEENQNDQGRRRRRRRQVDDLWMAMGGQQDASLNLGVDLENDFEDRPVGERQEFSSRTVGAIFSSRGQNKESLTTAAATDGEFEGPYARRQRFKRSRDTDDVLGESEEVTPEESKAGARLREYNNGRYGDDEEEDAESGSNERANNGKHNHRKAQQTGSGETLTDETNGNGSDDDDESGNSGEPTTLTNEFTHNNSDNDNNNNNNNVQDNNGLPGSQLNKTKRVFKQRHKTPPTHIVGMSPITVEYAVNYNREKHGKFVTPMFSTIVYKLDDIKEVFFLLLLLISLGEFFSAPAITIADSITLGYLGENTDHYGRQRMFGSLSWAITLLLVGMALDNSTSIADHPCGPHQRERSYTICFAIFSLLMTCALVTATQFKFYYSKSVNGTQPTSLLASTGENNTIVTTTTITADGTAFVDDPQQQQQLAFGGYGGGGGGTNVDDLYASTQPRSIFNTAPPVNEPPPGTGQQQGGKEKFEFIDKWKSSVFASRTWKLPEWVEVLRQLKNPLSLMYLFITWFLGCGVGLVFTFLFWHLQDVGGTPTLFGLCSVVNHISEVSAYFFSSYFIKRFGHTRVLSVGLGCNVIRFLYVAFSSNPYNALPFELVQGITHGACFAACCSYISHVSKPELKTSTQGVMQGIHHGIGRASGTLLGGFLTNAIGSRASFCIYGLLSGCVLATFLYIRKKVSAIADEEVKVDDSEALGGYGAPQGVPSAVPGKIAGQ